MVNIKQTMESYRRKLARRYSFVPNLSISDDRLQELYKKIKPVIQSDGKLCYIEDVNPREVSFIWNPKITTEATGIKAFKSIITFHTYGYYGLFKPTVSEVLSQIPDRYIDRCIAFRVCPILTSGNIVGNYHITITILYIKSDE